MQNTWAIGDVHGCYHTLLDLVSKLPKDSNLIFVGDLCDRGLYTKEVLEFVINNNHKCVLGNHDELMRLYLKKALKGIPSKWSTHPGYSGDKTVDSYRNASDELIEKHLAWLKSLPSYLEIENIFITHGFGMPYYKRRNDKKFERALRVNRLEDYKYMTDWEKCWEYSSINIFGHDSHQEVIFGKNFYGIDTACGYGNKLTAINLSSMNVINVITNLKDLPSSLKQ